MSLAEHRDPAGPHDADLAADALAGLSAPRKSLPCKWLYDARGAALFERITRLPEYYPTRTETGILRDRSADIAGAVGPGASVVEFGPGDGAKAVALLRALDRPAAYAPVEIAGEWLEAVVRRVRAALPHLPVHPVVADFTRPFDLPDALAREARLGFFPGSTIGNFTPEEAAAFLRRLAVTLGSGARLLLGVDLAKERSILEAAYDDAAGVTAAFNLNLLRRLNREAGANFDLAAFRHRAVWNEDAGRVEMHLVSLRPQRVRIAGQEIAFAEGEHIHTENSHKYRREGVEALAETGGWSVSDCWTDRDELFSVWLLRTA